MRIPRTISFTNPKLFQEIEDYAKQRSIDFSQAVSELSEAGIALFKKAGSLNLDNLTMISGLQADVDHLKGEVEKLWSIFGKHPSKFVHYRKMNLKPIEEGVVSPVVGEAFRTGRGRDFTKPLRKIRVKREEGSEE